MCEAVEAAEGRWSDAFFLSFALCGGYVKSIRVREVVFVAARRSWR